MSYYYKYNFASPEPIYAIVMEELKSYMDTGAIDNLMFPTYLDKCLRKLGRSSYVITQGILDICDFEARLPDNFYAVREAWMCTSLASPMYKTPNSFYSQAATEITIQVSPVVTNQHSSEPSCACPQGQCNCMPEMIQTVYKTNNEIPTGGYRREYLLKPGNISVKSNCSLDCMNFGSSAIDSFDIRDNKFVTNFREGTVNLVFYSQETDTNGNQLVPDNFRIREYIEAFIKYKMFETLSNQINDETFEQINRKLVYYKQLSEEAFIMADLEIKKQTVWDKQRRIKQDLNRFNMYELPGRNTRYGWRRNS